MSSKICLLLPKNKAFEVIEVKTSSDGNFLATIRWNFTNADEVKSCISEVGQIRNFIFRDSRKKKLYFRYNCHRSSTNKQRPPAKETHMPDLRERNFGYQMKEVV